MQVSVWIVALVCLCSALMSAQGSEPGVGDLTASEIRRAVEGTWVLEEWHIDGQVLRPPEVDGRRSNRDGVHIFIVNRHSNHLEYSQVGYGRYEIDQGSWSYGYERMERSNRPVDGPVENTVTRDPLVLRPYTARREGTKVILTGPNPADVREYDGPVLTLRRDGQITRRWRLVDR